MDKDTHGKWRITHMDGWDMKFVDLVVPGYFHFDKDNSGEFQLTASMAGWIAEKKMLMDRESISPRKETAIRRHGGASVRKLTHFATPSSVEIGKKRVDGKRLR